LTPPVSRPLGRPLGFPELGVGRRGSASSSLKETFGGKREDATAPALAVLGGSSFGSAKGRGSSSSSSSGSFVLALSAVAGAFIAGAPPLSAGLRSSRSPRQLGGRRPGGKKSALARLAFFWEMRLTVWKARMRKSGKNYADSFLGKDIPDLDLNVLPAMLPPRPPAGTAYSVTQKVWRKIVYWSRIYNYKKNEKFNTAIPTERALQKVAIIGGGAFGTAMAAHVGRCGNPVTMLIRNADVADFINARHVNPKYLPEFDLPEKVRATTDAAEALADCKVLISALPVQSSAEALRAVSHLLPRGVPVVALSKGMELGSRRLMCDLIPQALGRDESENPVVVVSGPSFAQEIMDRRPTSVVAASHSAEAAAQVQRLLTSRYFRVSITDDVIGVEVAGALKNVLAIAAGIVEGLGLGMNAMSALVTQGNAEIRWLATAMGAKPETLAGLSGMGDILLTCFGSLSRNRRVGVRLGKGEKIDDVLNSKGGVAEGVFTSRLVVELSDQHRVLLPVLTSVARILNREVEPRKALFEVLSLPPLAESA
ncbi:unnamed protein product, partial [Polarella glacialis]